MNCSVWAANSRYYIDGKALSISSKTYAEADTDRIAERVTSLTDSIDYNFFNENVACFVKAKEHRISYLKDEAYSFVRQATAKYKEENIVISFSGGKDSTVTADVVTMALRNPSLVDIFGNTTLDYPTSL